VGKGWTLGVVVFGWNAGAGSQRPSWKSREEINMASFLMAPLLNTAIGQSAGLPAKQARTDKLNEFVVILFLTAGPALGGVIFLTWLGGLIWGLLASLF